MTTRLELSGVHTHYATSHILFDVSLEVNQGESVCLLGRNGAGKTTTLKSIMSLAQASAGSIRFNGTDLVGRAPYEIARLGVGYVPDERLIFPDLTVRENLEIAAKRAPARRRIGRWSRSTSCFPCSRRSMRASAVISPAASSRC
jgi:branched-chain amino acid transport system ATP-binding protein